MASRKRRLAVNELPMLAIPDVELHYDASPVSDLESEDISDCEPLRTKSVKHETSGKPKYSRIPRTTTIRSFKPESRSPRPKSHKKVKQHSQTAVAQERRILDRPDSFTSLELRPTPKPKRQKKKVGPPRTTIANLFPLELRQGPHPDVDFLKRPKDSAVVAFETPSTHNLPVNDPARDAAEPTDVTDITPSTELVKPVRQESHSVEAIFAKLSTISAPARPIDSDTSEDDDDRPDVTSSGSGDDDHLNDHGGDVEEFPKADLIICSPESTRPARKPNSRNAETRPFLISKSMQIKPQAGSLHGAFAPASEDSNVRGQVMRTSNTAGHYPNIAHKTIHYGNYKPTRTTAAFSSLFEVSALPPSLTVEYPHLYDDRPELIPPPSGQGEREHFEKGDDELIYRVNIAGISAELIAHNLHADRRRVTAEAVRRTSSLLKPPFLRGR